MYMCSFVITITLTASGETTLSLCDRSLVDLTLAITISHHA